MKIMTSVAFPQPLKSFLLESPKPVAGPKPTLPPGPIYPGLLVNARPLVSQYPTLQSALDKIKKEQGLTGPPFVAVPPEQVPFLFAHEPELSLLKSVATLLAGKAHPVIKTGIEAIWVVYGASKWYREWKQPDRNTAACVFTLGGLAVDLASIPGGVYPSLELPKHFANTMNFIAKGGESLALGKLPPTNELSLSADERFAIPIKALKCFGVSLDQSPEFARWTTFPVAPAPAPKMAPVDAKSAPPLP
jgi:hypothetical protein